MPNQTDNSFSDKIYDNWYYPYSDYNLDVHHIDHNRKNNKPKNLILLCTRCHNKIGRYKPRRTMQRNKS
jgi:5-methylcytosine-specific restriction endonuclease McrA